MMDERKCKCGRDHFCSYVMDESLFDKKEKNYLINEILDNKLSYSLYIAVQLTVWGGLASFVDLFVMPTMMIYLGVLTKSILIVMVSTFY